MAKLNLPPILAQVAKEWDEIGPVRHRLIVRGEDLSFDKILTPYILKTLRNLSPSRALDIGCGTGDLSYKIASAGTQTHAIDISAKSLDIARAENTHPMLFYANESIDNFSLGNVEPFDMCIANMVLMDTPDIDSVLSAIHAAIKVRGILCLTIFHPIFYTFSFSKPFRGDYRTEVRLIETFRTTLYRGAQLFRSHWHRPIEMYVRKLIRAGFRVVSLDELGPPKSLRSLYGESGRFPRFLGITARSE
jgi:SAM-dependent methyltransferase